MPYLVYCIMRVPAVESPPMTGVTGKAVSFISAHGLAAAVSELPSAPNAPPVPELLAYGRVVEDLYHRQAVIPMRYGCFVDGMPAIERLLAERQRQYEGFLKELEGRVEMGIRVLVPEPDVKAPPAAAPVNGSNYLALRKAHYRIRDESSRQHQAVLDRYIQAFSGLQGKHRTETVAKDGSAVLSLYFLIRESQVNRFRQSFQRVVENEGPKTLLSGPWPPYNFATPEG